MRYNPLGRSGLYVSELCLGTMTFGGKGGIWTNVGGVQQDEADAMVRAAVDAGIHQSEHDPLGEDEAAGEIEILLHPVLVDRQIFEDFRE